MIDVSSHQIINQYCADYKFFFSKPNVVGIGYGYKVTNGINTYEPSIHVFVEEKVAVKSLSKDSIIPALYRGIKTDVIKMGRLSVGGDSASVNKRGRTNRIGIDDCSINASYTGRVRPIQPGWDMSVAYGQGLIETGTLGYIVIDREQISRTYCLLSVNKTFANFNKQKIGDVVIQPSQRYGGKAPEDVVGKLLRYYPLVFKKPIDPIPPLSEMNVIDASVASFYNKGAVQLINPFIPPNNVIPTGIGQPDIGKEVQWTGCFFGHQKGTINSISAIMKVKYPGDLVCWFKNIIITTGKYYISDEGALVYNNDRQAIGLLFSFGDTFGNLVCSIRSIEELLKIKLLTV